MPRSNIVSFWSDFMRCTSNSSITVPAYLYIVLKLFLPKNTIGLFYLHISAFLVVSPCNEFHETFIRNASFSNKQNPKKYPANGNQHHLENQPTSRRKRVFFFSSRLLQGQLSSLVWQFGRLLVCLDDPLVHHRSNDTRFRHPSRRMYHLIVTHLRGDHQISC